MLSNDPHNYIERRELGLHFQWIFDNYQRRLVDKNNCNSSLYVLDDDLSANAAAR